MRRLLPLLLAGSLWACSDSKTDPRDAGDHHHDDAGDHHHDAGHEPDDDAGEPQADAGTGSGLDQPEGKLERPPGEKLPDALKPPGFTH